MKVYQEKLVAAWKDFVAGTIDAKTLKGASSGFGIYQQRDGETMMRIRRPCGFLTTTDLAKAAGLVRKYGAKYLHLTTRQDVQIHGVKAADVPAALEDCEASGFPFRGGGGDTFRNTLVSAYSGLHADSVFDVAPYAKSLSRAFASFDLAYALPRKLKIAFADRPADAWLAESNDLGFLAKIVDGQRVFETYLAGGIGFKPKLGLKLFDALPVGDCIRVAMALTALFNDRGCRTNRMHARIRFLRDDFGDEGLVKLFHEYLAKVPADAPIATGDDVEPPPATQFASDDVAAAGFDVWRQLSVTDLRDGLAAVRIFVPFGNFTADEAESFARKMETFGATRFEILTTLDLGLVVPAAQLKGVYAALLSLGRDYTAASFVGNVRTCIGCTVCKSGVTDSPSIGRAVAEHFDKAIRPLDTPEKIALARMLLEDVRISGCPNSCTCQPLARFGFAGRKSNGQDAETPFSAGSLSPVSLGAPDMTQPPIVKDAFPAYLEKRLRDALA